MTLRSTLAVAALLALACAPSLAAPPSGFTADTAHDYSGLYLPEGLLTDDNAPEKPLKVGNWQLNSIQIDQAQPDEDPRPTTVTIVFEDPTSPKVKSPETGDESYSRQLSVDATAYVIAPDRLAFTATEPTLGAISFEGTFDADFMTKPAPDRNHPDDHPTLHGTLGFGGQSFTEDFVWYFGD